jgi:transcriptional regulator with XRE-family HTH domain
MAQVIYLNPERVKLMICPECLKRVRELRELTQDKLSEATGLNKQTIYRLERPERSHPVHKTTLDRLARALAVDPEVLTGEKPIPSDANQRSAAADEAAYQLNVRVDAAIRNAFELVARRYRVSVPKIAQLAPLLFVIIAEGSLKHRRKNLGELEDALKRLYEFEDIRSELQSKFPQIPFPNIDWDDQDEAINAERASIESRDLFGQNRFDPYDILQDEDNPFVVYLKALTTGREDITINAVGRTSTEYRVCRSEATELAGGDKQVADWLLNGEVPIHKIPRGLKTVEERVERIRQNKIPVSRVREEIPEEFPGDLDPGDFDIDISDIEL